MTQTNGMLNQEIKNIFSIGMLININQDFPSHSSAQVTELTKLAITNVLAHAETSRLIGDWKLVWGPMVDVTEFLFIKAPQNAICIYYNVNTKSYLVSIAGTDGYSIPTWLKEDLAVGTTEPLPFDNDGNEHILIAKGTHLGMKIIMGLKDPITGINAHTFLKDNVKSNDKIYICGHSLGGTLTTVYSLLVKNMFPDNEIYSMPVASSAIGNTEFAAYYSNKFDKDHNLRIWNEHDVAPHIFQLDMMKQIPDIYNQPGQKYPPIPIDLIFRGVVDVLYLLSSMHNYTQLDYFYSFCCPVIQPSQFNPPLTTATTSWPVQVQCQHVISYGYKIGNLDFFALVSEVCNAQFKDLEGYQTILGKFFTNGISNPFEGE